MVTMDKAQRGLAAFIDRELVPALTGWDKVIIGGGAGLIVARLPQLAAQYPILATLGLYDRTTNQIDIDSLYQSVIPHIGSDALPVTIPIVNIKMKISRTEIDVLYRYIKEA